MPSSHRSGGNGGIGFIEVVILGIALVLGLRLFQLQVVDAVGERPQDGGAIEQIGRRKDLGEVGKIADLAVGIVQHVGTQIK